MAALTGAVQAILGLAAFGGLAFIAMDFRNLMTPQPNEDNLED